MGAADFVNIIRKEILKINKNESYGFELATVVSSYPSLAIKVDNIKLLLTSQDLIICERLARNTRIVSLKSSPGWVRQLGDGTGTDGNSISADTGRLVSITSTEDNHQHTLADFDLEDFALDLYYSELDFEEVLKKGDRVLVQALSGGQKYAVIDRVVEYE